MDVLAGAAETLPTAPDTFPAGPEVPEAAMQHPAPKARQKRRSNYELKKAQLEKEEQKLKGLESAVHAHLVAAAAAGKESTREARQESAARVQAQVQLQSNVAMQAA